MMNVIALSLVVTSLAAAGLFGPAQQSNHQIHPPLESTIIKAGHRVVVVEYDEGGRQNTKISISENPNEAGSVPPNDASFNHSPKDLLCDAFGKCKEKISGAMGKAKDKVGEAKEDTTSFMHAPKDLICDAYGKCKEKISGAMGKAKDRVGEAKEDTTSFMHARKDSICDAYGKCKEEVSETARDIQEGAKAAARDLAGNVSSSREEAREAVKNVAEYLIGSLGLLRSAMNVVHVLGFSSGYGMCVWVTFISSYVLCRVLPRQQFGVVQSKIYPVYFRAMGSSIGLALLGHILGKAETFQAYNLLFSLVMVLVNSIYLEPRATKVMFERMKVEKEEGRGREDIAQPQTTDHHHPNKESTTRDKDAIKSQISRLNHKLRTLNSYSSFLNILTLMSLTGHLVYLAQLLHYCS